MKYYFYWCEELYKALKENKYLFLTVNTICFGILGLCIWYVLHFFCLNRIDWLICFIGYPAVIPGYLGGLFYFLRMD